MVADAAQPSRTSRYAVVVTAAMKPGSRGGFQRHHTPARLLCLLNGTISSLRATGWAGDIVCQTAGLLSAKTELAGLCTHVIELAVPSFDAGPSNPNVTEYRTWMHSRHRVPPPSSTRVQSNWLGSGQFTAVKLHVWTLVQYAMLMHADVDVRFLENPQVALEAAYDKKLVFQAAHAEVGGRVDYSGFNSHMLILRPSLELHAVMSANAAKGHFIPFTRTEQDVLESMFLPSEQPRTRTIARGLRELRWMRPLLLADSRRCLLRAQAWGGRRHRTGAPRTGSAPPTCGSRSTCTTTTTAAMSSTRDSPRPAKGTPSCRSPIGSRRAL